ncbi:cardiolipin synthase (CMP-forming) [Oncorhynchus nerka]|uniref:cardiolipin synthase (CMP-forming) n=1 Tax=Oncorhynchus nerka TaxID=8023 RepID=UPI0031B7F705
MFLSVSKNNLAVCARSVCWAIPASWRQQTGVCVRVELKLLQRLKNRVSSVAQWSSHTQYHTHIPSPTTPEVSGQELKGSTESVSRYCRRRGHERTQGNDDRFRFYPKDHSSSNSHVLLGLRLFPVSSGVFPGWRGLCSGKPRETPADCPPGVDLRETTQPADRPSDLGQGLFKFKELYENPWTIPNLLCVCRIALAPVLGILITEQHFHLSLGLFALAGFTDVLDGYIARNWPSQKSALGSALDPLADKILISVLYISLTYAQLIPAPLTALVIARDLGLIAAVFYVRYKTVPPPVTLSKFFNPCYTTAQLKPTTLSKVNTAIQLFLVAASLASPVFHYTDSPLLQALWYITAVTTTVSGYSYYHYGMKTVAVLNSTK